MVCIFELFVKMASVFETDHFDDRTDWQGRIINQKLRLLYSLLGQQLRESFTGFFLDDVAQIIFIVA